MVNFIYVNYFLFKGKDLLNKNGFGLNVYVWKNYLLLIDYIFKSFLGL